MRIAVTGASGFVGGAICASLRAEGHEVLPLGRRAAEALTQPLPGYRSWDLAVGPLPTLDVDALVHAGAAVGQWGSREAFWRANVLGTQHAVASVPSHARIVAISTASVYARSAAAGPRREDAPLVTRGLTPYDGSKAAADRYVLELGARAVVLRPHVVYGPGDTTLWPRVLRAVRGGVLRVPGDGSALISTTHIAHLVAAVHLALRTPSAGAFNIADAAPTSVDTLLRTMFARRGMPVRLRYLPRALALAAASVTEAAWSLSGRRDDPPLTRYAVRSLADGCVLEIGRARRELGYAPWWTVADGPL